MEGPQRGSHEGVCMILSYGGVSAWFSWGRLYDTLLWRGISVILMRTSVWYSLMEGYQRGSHEDVCMILSHGGASAWFSWGCLYDTLSWRGLSVILMRMSVWYSLMEGPQRGSHEDVCMILSHGGGSGWFSWGLLYDTLSWRGISVILMRTSVWYSPMEGPQRDSHEDVCMILSHGGASAWFSWGRLYDTLSWRGLSLVLMRTSVWYSPMEGPQRDSHEDICMILSHGGASAWFSWGHLYDTLSGRGLNMVLVGESVWYSPMGGGGSVWFLWGHLYDTLSWRGLSMVLMRASVQYSRMEGYQCMVHLGASVLCPNTGRPLPSVQASSKPKQMFLSTLRSHQRKNQQ